MGNALHEVLLTQINPCVFKCLFWTHYLFSVVDKENKIFSHLANKFSSSSKLKCSAFLECLMQYCATFVIGITVLGSVSARKVCLWKRMPLFYDIANRFSAPGLYGQKCWTQNHAISQSAWLVLGDSRHDILCLYIQRDLRCTLKNMGPRFYGR